jgi:hypothetical protein
MTESGSTNQGRSSQPAWSDDPKVSFPQGTKDMAMRFRQRAKFRRFMCKSGPLAATPYREFDAIHAAILHVSRAKEQGS